MFVDHVVLRSASEKTHPFTWQTWMVDNPASGAASHAELNGLTRLFAEIVQESAQPRLVFLLGLKDHQKQDSPLARFGADPLFDRRLLKLLFGFLVPVGAERQVTLADLICLSTDFQSLGVEAECCYALCRYAAEDRLTLSVWIKCFLNEEEEDKSPTPDDERELVFPWDSRKLLGLFFACNISPLDPGSRPRARGRNPSLRRFWPTAAVLQELEQAELDLSKPGGVWRDGPPARGDWLVIRTLDTRLSAATARVEGSSTCFKTLAYMFENCLEGEAQEKESQDRRWWTHDEPRFGTLPWSSERILYRFRKARSSGRADSLAHPKKASSESGWSWPWHSAVEAVTRAVPLCVIS